MSTDTSQWVHTPFGLVPESKVFRVNSHETIKVVDGRVVKAELESGRVIAEYGEADPEAGHAPYEYAAQLREQAGVGDPDWQPAAAGYPLNGYYTSDDSITRIQSFSTTWNVPSKPRPGFTYLYLWNGLSGGGLQPVQKWTKGRDTHQPWIVNFAYVSGAGYVHGPDKDVAPGEEVTGRVRYIGREQGGDGYVYTVSFVGHPELDLTVVRPKKQGPADGVVQCWEAYSDQPTWPTDTKVGMRKIALTMQAGTPLPPDLKWGSSGKHVETPSGKNIEVVNTSSTSGEVDFYFQ
ncbi:hypothetical protein [Embleya sp. NPDC005971]|uniref:hypothetical protein n=1 Tax=Embleya sp. NPDC005971 TaxID=3156724 RepID=UPI0034079826